MILVEQKRWCTAKLHPIWFRKFGQLQKEDIIIGYDEEDIKYKTACG